MTDPAYHLSYVMQRGDFVALTRALMRPSRFRLVASALLVVGAAIFGYLAAALPQSGPPPDATTLWIIAGIYAVIIAVVLFPLRWLYLRVLASIVYRRNAAADKTMTFAIDEAAITGGMPGISSTVAWPAVTRLIETQQHLFVAISRREALILPRRAFADDVAYRAFAAFARDRVAATRSVDPQAQSA